jgi:hypothetical protein
MQKTLTFTYERVDDIPLLLAHLERMGVQQLLDKHFPTHGNWQGLSLGWVASIWLGHILSQGDHRFRLLSIGLRMLTLLEFQVRRGLATQQEIYTQLGPEMIKPP